MKVYKTESEQETQLLATKVIKKYFGKSWHTIFLLQGNLGVGKTQFIKGVAKGLRINPRKIHSPTFVFITNLLQKNFILYHIDFYRIDKKYIANILHNHLEEISLQNCKTVTCIEWADKINGLKIKWLKHWAESIIENKKIVTVLKIKFQLMQNLSRKIVITKL